MFDNVGDDGKRAARGARWLDREMPGWHNRLNPHRLSHDDGGCVIGQLTGSFGRYAGEKFSYFDNVRDAVLHPFSFVRAGTWAYRNGFLAIREDEWRAAWTQEVLDRRAKQHKTAAKRYKTMREGSRDESLAEEMALA